VTAAAAHAIDYDALTRQFLAAQLAGDRREALRLVVDDGLSRGARVLDVQSRVIRAAQYELGLLWQANRISIAEEHLATGIAQVVLARLFEYARPAPRNGRAIAIACVQGELHELPARLVADYLDQGGFAVRYYGANVPTDALVPMLRAEPPSLLALSATMSFHVSALREAVTRVRAELDPSLPILIGGHAVMWESGLPSALDVETAPSAPEELIGAVCRLTGVA
jgi:methanogenic corrinoid protein MtbC1